MFLTRLGIRRLLVLLETILLGAATGCASDEGVPKLVPVAGKVTVGGKPLPGAAISFRPDAGKGAPSPHIPSGKTDEQGNYLLATVGKKGAPAGWYKVVVVMPNKMAGAPGSRPPPREARDINDKYAKAETTDLSAEVKDGQGALSFDFNLSP